MCFDVRCSHKRKEHLMSFPAFEATGFVNFKLKTGSIHTKDEEKMALLPIEFLQSIAPTEELDEAARRFGNSQGAKLLSEMQKENSSLGMEILVNHLGGALAVLGLGKTKIELFGDALTFHVQHNDPQRMPPAITAIIQGFIAGFLSSLKTDSQFEVIAIDDAPLIKRFWAGNPIAAKKLRKLLEEGKQPIEALTLLV